jgi:hypothetical protein
MNIDNIVNDRQLKASIGLSFKEWQELSLLFDGLHQDIYGVSLEDKFRNLGIHPILKNSKEVVFFVLFQLKNAFTYDVLGVIFGTNASNAQSNFKGYLPLIHRILDKQALLPARNLQEWEKTLGKEEEIYIDATEIPIQRPVNQEEQKKLFSGKKKGICSRVR